MEKQYPLIVVIYLSAEMFRNRELIGQYSAYLEDVVAKKEANIVHYIMPTLGEERVECINPIMLKEADMEKINALVEEIKKNFDINPEINVPVEEITLEGKTCNCGKNEGGECLCEPS